jgi:hypothetical protein
MAHPVIHESKHILKKVAIGATTSLVGAVIIYFLYNRSPSRASDIEIKKNTIETWKAYVTLENANQVKSDSNLTKVNRALIIYKDKYPEKTQAIKDFRQRDSLDREQFKKDIQSLEKTKDIDKEFSILLGNRAAYLDEQISFNIDYQVNFAKLVLDSVLPDNIKNSDIQDINAVYNGKMQNLTERIGRNIEDLSVSLSKKYDYSFSLSDFAMYSYYMNLKKMKNQLSKPAVAPSAPGKTNPSLPD